MEEIMNHIGNYVDKHEEARIENLLVGEMFWERNKEIHARDIVDTENIANHITKKFMESSLTTKDKFSVVRLSAIGTYRSLYPQYACEIASTFCSIIFLENLIEKMESLPKSQTSKNNREIVVIFGIEQLISNIKIFNKYSPNVFLGTIEWLQYSVDKLVKASSKNGLTVILIRQNNYSTSLPKDYEGDLIARLDIDDNPSVALTINKIINRQDFKETSAIKNIFNTIKSILDVLEDKFYCEHDIKSSIELVYHVINDIYGNVSNENKVYIKELVSIAKDVKNKKQMDKLISVYSKTIENIFSIVFDKEYNNG